MTLAVKTASASPLFSDADCEVFVIAAAQDGTADPEPGTYAFTNAGIGSMKTRGGSVAIARGAVAFAPAPDPLPPALISLLPASVDRAGALRWVMPPTFPAVLGFDFPG